MTFCCKCCKKEINKQYLELDLDLWNSEEGNFEKNFEIFCSEGCLEKYIKKNKLNLLKYEMKVRSKKLDE